MIPLKAVFHIPVHDVYYAGKYVSMCVCMYVYIFMCVYVFISYRNDPPQNCLAYSCI